MNAVSYEFRSSMYSIFIYSVIMHINIVRCTLVLWAIYLASEEKNCD